MRVTDLRGVDLDTFRFDFDLTFAVLLMHPDGTVYHRFGGRDATSADAALSQAALTRLLRETLGEHRGHEPVASGGTPRTLDDIPAWRKRVEARAARGEKPLGCYHCHFVYESEHAQALEDGTWRLDRVWRWPPPAQVGLTLDRMQQDVVAAVASGSLAEQAGLRAGDRLCLARNQRLLSWSDLSWVLERSRGGATSIELVVRRADGEEKQLRLPLPEGWERGDALALAWRPSKWTLTPTPGFGGDVLGAEAKAKAGLAAEPFALRVTYMVDWGRERRYGQAAAAAGIKKGDVVLAVNGRREWVSHDHFQAWWRLELHDGETVQVELLREGERHTVELTLPP